MKSCSILKLLSQACEHIMTESECAGCKEREEAIGELAKKDTLIMLADQIVDALDGPIKNRNGMGKLTELAEKYAKLKASEGTEGLTKPVVHDMRKK